MNDDLELSDPWFNGGESVVTMSTQTRSTDMLSTETFPVMDPSKQRSVVPPGSSDSRATHAPWPQADKYPTVVGSNLTLQYLSACFRMSQTGYRREYVDVLDELMERDAHAYACVSQRVFAVAGARFNVMPARCDAGEEEAAKKVALEVESVINAIPHFKQSLASLLWGNFYGVGGSEIDWAIHDGRVVPAGLHWIHSRRLAYPEAFSWDVRIWDLGSVSSWGMDPTSKTFGLDPTQLPGKFIIHSPQLRGDYPTRDGYGREIAYWMAIKLMAARNFAQFIERFGKPWPIGYYATTKEGDKHPRAATDDDIQALDRALMGVGAGALSKASLPDSVHVSLDGPSAAALPREMPQAALMRVCNQEIAKAILGNSDTIEASQNGSRSATETRQESTLEIYRYDAACLCDTIKRDLVWWYVHLNHPGMEHLCPIPVIDVEPPPDRETEAKIVALMVQSGAPVDADEAASKTGVRLIPNTTDQPRRLGWCKPADPSTFDPQLNPSPDNVRPDPTAAPETGQAASKKEKP